MSAEEKRRALREALVNLRSDAAARENAAGFVEASRDELLLALDAAEGFEALVEAGRAYRLAQANSSKARGSTLDDLADAIVKALRAEEQARTIFDALLAAAPTRPGPVEDIGPSVKVGDSLWVVDRGMRTSPYRVVIASESRTHWAIDRGRDSFKVAKVRPESPPTAPNERYVSRSFGSGLSVYLNDKALADARWIESHRHLVADRVRETSSADLLRQVAELLGYDYEPQARDAGPMNSVGRR